MRAVPAWGLLQQALLRQQLLQAVLWLVGNSPAPESTKTSTQAHRAVCAFPQQVPLPCVCSLLLLWDPHLEEPLMEPPETARHPCSVTQHPAQEGVHPFFRAAASALQSQIIVSSFPPKLIPVNPNE